MLVMQARAPYQKHTYLALTKMLLHYQLTFLYCKATERETFEKCVNCKTKLIVMYFTSNPVSQANRQKTIKVFYFTTSPVSLASIEKKCMKKWVYQRNKTEFFHFIVNPISQARGQKTCMKKNYGSTQKTK